MRNIILVFIGINLLNISAFGQDKSQTSRLKVSENRHFLLDGKNNPFFWLGDTAWEMFHRLDQNEVIHYLETRKNQGFNIVQAVLLSEFEGLSVPNAYGSVPLIDEDPTKFATTEGDDVAIKNEYDYWDHADFIIEQADKLGIYVGLLPCWGEYVTPRESVSIFKTKEQAYIFGNILGKRYQKRKNIVWILGGDRLPDESSDGIAIWRSMAKGIADGTNDVSKFEGETDYSSTLMTYHCFASSSQWFHKEDWLDFHMWGSYHSDFNLTRSYEQAELDWNLSDQKPTINGEPAYEEHFVNWLENNGQFQAYDVRQAAYWSVFGGAFGHTYGCHPVWQFFDKGRIPISFANKYWKNALSDEGASQLKYLKNLIESRPMLDRIPDQSIISKGSGNPGNRAIATRGKNYIFVYIPTGNPVTLKMGQISGETVNASWYDPRTGETTKIGSFKNSGELEFAPKGISKELSWLRSGRGCDWVLIVDDSSAGFANPSNPKTNINRN